MTMKQIKCPFCKEDITEEEMKEHVIKHLGAIWNVLGVENVSIRVLGLNVLNA